MFGDISVPKIVQRVTETWKWKEHSLDVPPWNVMQEPLSSDILVPNSRVDGIGEKLIEALLDSGMVSTIADLYRLSHSDITSLERMGDKSAYNVLDELSKTKTLNLARFLRIRNRKNWSEVATTISQYFSSLERLLDWVENGEIEN